MFKRSSSFRYFQSSVKVTTNKDCVSQDFLNPENITKTVLFFSPVKTTLNYKLVVKMHAKI